MNLTELREIKDAMSFGSLSKKPSRDFSKLMSKPNHDCADTPLIDGPIIPQLAPIQSNVGFFKILDTMPAELTPFVQQIPAEIEILRKSGVMQTKITIELPSHESVEVVIDRYDTAQTSFHISFYGSEQTGNLIAQKQSELVRALQAALPHFSFAISPPFLSPPVFSLPKSRRFGYSPVKKGSSRK